MRSECKAVAPPHPPSTGRRSRTDFRKGSSTRLDVMGCGGAASDDAIARANRAGPLKV
jgi:hypothetical protein